MGMQNQRPTSHAMAISALALAGCLWGTGFLFGKIAMTEMTVTENVSFRFLTGAILLLPVVLRRWKPYRGRDLLFMLVASAVGIPIQFLIQFRGLQLTTVSHASLIVGVLPVMLAVSSSIFLKERLSRLEWGALLLSAGGAVLIAMSAAANQAGPRPTARGDLLVLISLFAAVAMILVSKRLIPEHGALHVTAVMIVTGTVMLLIWAEISQPLRFHFSPSIWGAAIAQGVLATAGAYLCWNWGLSHMAASRAGVFLNLEPVMGTVLGLLILHEHLDALAILGGLLIVGAAAFFSVRTQNCEASIDELGKADLRG